MICNQISKKLWKSTILNWIPPNFDSSAIFAGGRTSGVSNVVDVRNRDGFGMTGTNLSQAREYETGGGGATALYNAIFPGGQLSTIDYTSTNDIRNNLGEGSTGASLSTASCTRGASAQDRAVFFGGSKLNLPYVDEVTVYDDNGIKFTGTTPATATYFQGTGSAGSKAVAGGGRQTKTGDGNNIDIVHIRDRNGLGYTGTALPVAKASSVGVSAGQNVLIGGGTPSTQSGVDYRNESGFGGSGTNLIVSRISGSAGRADTKGIFAHGINDASINHYLDIRDEVGTGGSATYIPRIFSQNKGAHADNQAIFGGSGGSANDGSCTMSDSSGYLRTGTDLSQSRNRISGAHAEKRPMNSNIGRAIFVGGANGASTSDIYSSTDLRDSNGIGTQGANLSSDRTRVAGASAEDMAVFVGGRNPSNSATNLIDLFDSNGVQSAGVSNSQSYRSRSQGATAIDKAIFARGDETAASTLIDILDRDGVNQTGVNILSTTDSIAALTVEDLAVFITRSSTPVNMVSADGIAFSNTSGTTTVRTGYFTGATAGMKGIIGPGTTDTAGTPGRFISLVNRDGTISNQKTVNTLNQNTYTGCRCGQYAAFFGGTGSINQGLLVDEYNTETLVTIPIMNTNLAAAAIDITAIYAGGSNDAGVPVGTVFLIQPEYSVINGTTPLSNLKTYVGAATAGGMESGAAVFAGGYAGSNLFDTVEARNDRGVGNTLTSLSSQKKNLAGASAGMYAVFGGGQDNSGTLFNTIDFISHNNVSGIQSNLIQARHSLAATGIENIALFSGGDSGSDSSIVELVNIQGGGTSGTNLYEARKNHAMAVAGLTAVIVGGGKSTAEFRDKYANITATQITEYTRNKPAAVSIGQYAVVLGGTSSSQICSFYRSDAVRTNTSATFVANAGAGASVDKTKGIIVDGYTTSNSWIFREDLTYSTAISVQNLGIYVGATACKKGVFTSDQGRLYCVGSDTIRVDGTSLSGMPNRNVAAAQSGYGTNQKVPTQSWGDQSSRAIIFGGTTNDIQFRNNDGTGGTGTGGLQRSTWWCGTATAGSSPGSNIIACGGGPQSDESLGVFFKDINIINYAGARSNGTYLSSSDAKTYMGGGTAGSQAIFAGGKVSGSTFSNTIFSVTNGGVMTQLSGVLATTKHTVSGAAADSTCAIFAGGRVGTSSPTHNSQATVNKVTSGGVNSNLTNLSTSRVNSGSATLNKTYSVFWNGNNITAGTSVLVNTIEMYNSAGSKSNLTTPIAVYSSFFNGITTAAGSSVIRMSGYSTKYENSVEVLYQNNILSTGANLRYLNYMPMVSATAGGIAIMFKRDQVDYRNENGFGSTGTSLPVARIDCQGGTAYNS